MKIVACYKVVPDAQDITVNSDGTLNLSKARMVLGDYDLMAIEEAVKLSQSTDGSAVLLTAGDSKIADSKLTKAALSRGADELFCIVDDAMASADAFQTASILASALEKIDYDLVICGEGSADLYAQQVGGLLGSLLGVPTLNSVSRIELQGDAVEVERTLENEVEVIEMKLPAVISVTTDINLPRIPQLKDILAAGKKSVTIWSFSDVGDMPSSKVKTISVQAPQDIKRKNVVYESGCDEDMGKLAANIKASW